jgi:hypothetical protein
MREVAVHQNPATAIHLDPSGDACGVS